MPATASAHRDSAVAIRTRVGADPLGTYAAILGCSPRDFIKRSASEQAVRCKLHNDQRPSLRVNTSKGLWRCDPCGKGGDAFDLYAALHGLNSRTDFPRILEEMAGTLGVSLSLPPILLNGDAGKNGNHHPQVTTGVTISALAKAKGLPESYLLENGVEQARTSLLFHYFNMDGRRAERHRLRRELHKRSNGEDHRFSWAGKLGHPTAAYGLWKISEWRKQRIIDLSLVEGETDSLTLWFHKRPALGIPGASNGSVLQKPHVQGFERIWIVREPDAGGETFVAGMTARLGELRYQGEVRIICMPEGTKDPNELHLRTLGDPGGFESEWSELQAKALRVELPFIGAILRTLSSVTAEKVKWIWDGRIPESKLILFAGDPGEMKSTIATDIVSRISRGERFPDGRPGYGPASSILLTAEDGLADTVRPRMEAAGADLDRIRVIDLVRSKTREGEVVDRGFNLTTDLPFLEENLKESPDPVRAVVIDPVPSYMGATDSHKNADVRTVLAPLAKLAEKYRCAIIMITHLNKGIGSPQHRVTGSIAFVAAARAAYLFMTDPDDENTHLMLPLKMNLAAKGSGLKYRAAEAPNGSVYIDWLGETTKTPDEVMALEAEGRKPQQRGEAAELLLNMLRDGPRWTVEVEREGATRGISVRTMYRAREQLKVEAFREGGTSGRWMLKLPE